MHHTFIERPWPTTRFPGILFGGDYNPEQWTPAMGYDGETIWHDDLRLMRQAGVNLVSIGIFSWAMHQPDEHTFTFDWLASISTRFLNSLSVATSTSSSRSSSPSCTRAHRMTLSG